MRTFFRLLAVSLANTLRSIQKCFVNFLNSCSSEKEDKCPIKQVVFSQEGCFSFLRPRTFFRFFFVQDVIFQLDLMRFKYKK